MLGDRGYCKIKPQDCGWVWFDVTTPLEKRVPKGFQVELIKSNVFIKTFVHQLISQSAVQKPSLKPQTASNAGVEARWLGKTP